MTDDEQNNETSEESARPEAGLRPTEDYPPPPEARPRSAAAPTGEAPRMRPTSDPSDAFARSADGRRAQRLRVV